MSHFAVFLLLTSSLMAIACQSKSKVFEAPAVSMTHASLGANETLIALGSVSGKFCADPIRDRGEVGMLDEALRDAQSSREFDFLTDVSLYLLTNGCVEVEGTAQKIQAQVQAQVQEKKPATEKHSSLHHGTRK